MDKNGNENCLKGYACPQCGNYRRLKITALTTCELTDAGSGEHEGLEYDEKAPTECPECGYGGPLRWFRLGALKRFDVVAVERFLVRTTYRNVLAADKHEAKRRCKGGQEAYEDKEILEGDEIWVRTEHVEEVAGEPAVSHDTIQAWFQQYDLASKLEGWLLTNDEEDCYCLARLDDPSSLADTPGWPADFVDPKFDGDAAALRFVRDQARAGSDWHAEALAIHAAKLPLPRLK